MESSICRVCLGNSTRMVNILDATHESGMSIASMISKCTDRRVEKDDILPKTVCPSCLEDVKNAFEIIETYERSDQFYRFFNDLQEEERENEGSGCSDEDMIKDGECNEDNHQANSFGTDAQERIERTEDDLESEDSNDDFDDDDSENDKDYAPDLDDSDSKADDNRLSKEKRRFQCSQCSKSLTTKQSLERHLQIHKAEGTFKCTQCVKTFRKDSHFQAHMRAHTGERPYKCSHCSKTFPFNKSLKNHMLVHTGEQQFKCSHCSKAFIDSACLKAHLQTHSGETPFQCSLCSKKYPNKQNLARHMRSHTGERPFQ
ncbi:zinc finger protein 431 [Drosophila biarmipes]|uniref:zinc finger protein 431 n=1 Tax=Drosophila biarmipes TaxID=125945 RepID=UPI0007E6B818|nr:zinc finger protein 431 [Drosophila biarmipes]XP_016959421.1 zinc finger protein 431 [Drosophila biarmipes]XP_016959422.1 zinc finger protein 431 [Drosophila biarmipes]